MCIYYANDFKRADFRHISIKEFVCDLHESFIILKMSEKRDDETRVMVEQSPVSYRQIHSIQLKCLQMKNIAFEYSAFKHWSDFFSEPKTVNEIEKKHLIDKKLFHK